MAWLPDNSGYETTTINTERTISAGESLVIGFLQIDQQMAIHREQIDKLERTAVFHGWVRYFPLVGPPEESFADYCYVYRPSIEVLERRDGYNTNRRQKKPSDPPN